MPTILHTLKQHFAHAIQEAFQEKFTEMGTLAEPDITQSTQENLGDYQCNSALKIGKALRMSPIAVAEKIMQAFRMEGVKKISIAGPGFINISLSEHYIADKVVHILSNERLGVEAETPKKIIVEFSSPNIAKELHVGHLRSTIIGDALARLFEFLGHDVLRLNHIGDWGTQFGMLIQYLKEHQSASLENPQGCDLPTLMHWYKQAKLCFDADEAFKKRAQLQVVALQSGDPVARRAWQAICDISRQAFQEIYDLLDVELIERGESFYNPMLQPIVQQLQDLGLVEISEGARCIFLPGFTGQGGNPLPMIIQKSDGGYNYDTTDVAALKHRLEVEKAERIVIVTDAGQALHFQMLFALGKEAKFYDPQKIRLDHVPFGVVLGPDGKKFKTRSGETEKLIDLLTEAITKAKKVLDEKVSDTIPEEEKQQIAQILGIDAIKYADLSCHRVKDYVFSYDRMLRFEGNTAAFLLYAYVRIQGIKRKVDLSLTSFHKIAIGHPSEMRLALHLCQFGEALEAMAEELLPNRLTDYLYLLAEKFHGFFRDCRVEGSEQAESRLLLCEATARILQKGLEILGLKTVARM